MSRLVFGTHPVMEALAARRRAVLAVYTTDPALHRQARASGIPSELRAKPDLDALAGPGARHQGAIAIVGEYPYVGVDDILSTGSTLLLALDSITDPQNLGSLVRSAQVLGAGGVLVPKDRAAQVTPAVVRASAGATEHIAIAQVTNLVRELEGLKERGFWIVGTVAGGAAAVAPWQVDFRQPTVIVIGAEGTGVRRLVARVCDVLVTIPMHGQVASFGAAAAGAMLLYEAMRQRIHEGG